MNITKIKNMLEENASKMLGLNLMVIGIKLKSLMVK